MVVKFTENFSIYTDPRFGGITGTVNGLPVDGVFDEEYVDIPIGSIPIVGVKPIFRVETADIPGAKKGDPVVVNGISYEIITPQADSTGMTDLILEKQ